MQESIVISKTSHARLHHLTDVRISRPVYKWVIRLTRDHHAHVNSGFCCDNKRVPDIIIWYEIRRLYKNIFSCHMDQAQIIVTDLLTMRVRSAGNDLHRITPVPDISRQFKQMILQKNIISRCIIPVQCKTDCKRSDRRSFDTNVGISPVSEFLIFSQILSSNIKSADKADSSIDHCNLPVVSVIHTKLQFS